MSGRTLQLHDHYRTLRNGRKMKKNKRRTSIIGQVERSIHSRPWTCDGNTVTRGLITCRRQWMDGCFLTLLLFMNVLVKEVKEWVRYEVDELPGSCRLLWCFGGGSPTRRSLHPVCPSHSSYINYFARTLVKEMKEWVVRGGRVTMVLFGSDAVLAGCLVQVVPSITSSPILDHLHLPA